MFYLSYVLGMVGLIGFAIVLFIILIKSNDKIIQGSSLMFLGLSCILFLGLGNGLLNIGNTGNCANTVNNTVQFNNYDANYLVDNTSINYNYIETCSGVGFIGSALSNNYIMILWSMLFLGIIGFILLWKYVLAQGFKNILRR